MPIPRYSTENYRDALLNLLPLGPIWNRARDGAFAALFTVLGAVYQRNNNQAADLVSDVFPATTSGFLLEWEKTLGLPDPCTGPLPTAEQRRFAIVAKLTDEGGSSRDYYVNLARNLGVDITIREFAPARAGCARAGDPVYGEGWIFAWEVVSNSVLWKAAAASVSAAGDPLAYWGNALLQCAISQRAPAHTVLLFAYLPYSALNSYNDFAGDVL